MANWSTWFSTVLKTRGAGNESSPRVVIVGLAQPSTAADPAVVASQITNITIVASNPLRRGAIIYNDSTQVLTIKFGATAAANDFTTKIPAATEYRVPFDYTGQIDGFWAGANGNARVTELLD